MKQKVWYLANGKKKVGPMSTDRVLERVAAGKVPSAALAWREGMDEWLAVGEIDELQAEPEEATPPAKKTSSNGKVQATKDKAPVRKKKKTTGKVRAVSAPRKAPAKQASSRPSGFEQPYRIERADVWRGYGLGVDVARVKIVLTAFGAAGLISGLVSGVGQLASMAHVLLGLPFVLLGGLVGLVLALLGEGALSYHSRCKLEGREAGIKEALGFAWKNAGAIAGPPIVLSVAWLLPLILLVVISLMIKIPYAGPVGTGLLFGVHIALSAVTFFMVLAAGMASVFGPVIVAFEGTGFKGTLGALLAFVKRATARIIIWSALPGLAFLPFAMAVLTIGAVVLALPLATVAGPMVSEVQTAFAAGGELPGGLFLGAIPMALWISVFVYAAIAILGSVKNALVSYLYLGGREGNDERISRDAFLARLAAEEV